MAGHAQLKFVMTECSKTQIRLTGPKEYSGFKQNFKEYSGFRGRGYIPWDSGLHVAFCEDNVASRALKLLQMYWA